MQIDREVLREVEAALMWLTPSHISASAYPCWCPRQRDIPGFGHSIECLKAAAALARLRKAMEAKDG